jgi:chromosome segregation ATPase
MSDWVRDWVPIVSFLGMMIAILITVLHRAPMVSASRLSTLRQIISDQSNEIADLSSQVIRLTQSNDRLTSELERLRARIEVLLGDVEYWKMKFQEIDRRLSKMT